MPKGFKGFQKGNQLGKMNKGNSRCAWNKGLTKEIDERVMKSSKKCSETEKIQYQIYGRKPSFGFLGKKHSIKWKKEQSKRFSGNKNPSKREEVKIKIREARKKQICPVKDTSIEIKIQNFLKQLNMEFYTHQYINIKHGYQYDILIPSMNLIIECD